MEGREEDSTPLSPRHRETYVIQIPKDQIYRVPPPENDATSKTPSQTKRSCFEWRLCMAFITVILNLLFIVAVLFLYFALSPQTPSFSIIRFVENVSLNSNDNKKVNPNPNPNPKNHISHISTSFEIVLNVENENSRAGIYYEKNGFVTLSLRRNIIGHCQFPTMKQMDKSSTKVRIIVRGKGNHKGLMNETKSIVTVVPLDLKMKIPVTMNLWLLKIWKNDILIDCKFKVSKLKKKSGSFKILSQKCKTQISP